MGISNNYVTMTTRATPDFVEIPANRVAQRLSRKASICFGKTMFRENNVSGKHEMISTLFRSFLA